MTLFILPYILLTSPCLEKTKKKTTTKTKNGRELSYNRALEPHISILSAVSYYYFFFTPGGGVLTTGKELQSLRANRKIPKTQRKKWSKLQGEKCKGHNEKINGENVSSFLRLSIVWCFDSVPTLMCKEQPLLYPLFFSLIFSVVSKTHSVTLSTEKGDTQSSHMRRGTVDSAKSIVCCKFSSLNCVLSRTEPHCRQKKITGSSILFTHLIQGN